MGMTWHGPDFREVELHREANDNWFGAPEQSDTYPNPLTEWEEEEAREEEAASKKPEPDDHAASSVSVELPATMDEIIQRRNGTDEDPEGMFT